MRADDASDLDELVDDIPSRPFPTYDEISYETFLTDHLIPNKPLLLSSAHTADWSSLHRWRLPRPIPSSATTSLPSSLTDPTTSSSSKGNTDTASVPSLPDFSALRPYSNHIVPTANTSRRLYSEFERSDLPLGHVFDLWERGEGKDLYVKDWHLLDELEKSGKGVEEVYSVPEIFRDDWLNPPYTPHRDSNRIVDKDTTSGVDKDTTSGVDKDTISGVDKDTTSGVEGDSSSSASSTADFRFVYLGPKGTYTPLHRDVYASYSWSANVLGRKLWWFFPPGESLDAVKDSHGEPVFDVRDVRGGKVGIRVLQNQGEVVFVPSGWWHQVINLDFCISINHNFFSSPALPHILPALETSQNRVEESISDVRDMINQRLGPTLEAQREWVDEVQALLERDQGWNWAGFLRIVRDNLLDPKCGSELRPPDSLVSDWVRRVIELVKDRDEMMIMEIKELIEEIERLLVEMDSTLTH